jgi:hypothetical protein
MTSTTRINRAARPPRAFGKSVERGNLLATPFEWVHKQVSPFYVLSKEP